ncbi:MAG: divalent-cation tolerance protein CutA [Pyrinomonadaceae bacterium]
MKAIMVFITSANREEAEKIARILVEERQAACVQILSQIKSFYRWQGEVIQDKEILLLAKTTAENFAELEKTVCANHSYEVPEIVAVPATQISEPYLNWLWENTTQ